MAFFLILHSVGSWLGWLIIRSFRRRAIYLVEIDRDFIASESNLKRVQRVATLGEILLGSLFWPLVVLGYTSDANSFESAYVRAFHQKVLAKYTRAQSKGR